MQKTLSAIRIPALISALLVLPFIALELVNRRDYGEPFAIQLFTFLWGAGLVFFVILMPIARRVRMEGRAAFKSAGLLLGACALIFLAWLWFSVVQDQMPCFLGVPLCD